MALRGEPRLYSSAIVIVFFFLGCSISVVPDVFDPLFFNNKLIEELDAGAEFSMKSRESSEMNFAVRIIDIVRTVDKPLFWAINV
jgi:hypothetical protein